MIRKDIKNFINCESALSEIITAIMLLAIVVFMIAIIQTQSVPEWNKAVEMDHFNVVYDDFLKIRSDIENAALFQFPKSGVIHMGAHYPGRLIFINPADTSGTLTSTNVTWINVSYKPFNQTPTYFNNSSTSIKFVPNYNYYSNAPSFVYEHGLVIKDFTTDNYIYTDTSQAIFGNNIINVFMLAYPQEFVSFSGINALNYNLQSKNSTANNTNVTVTFYTNYPRLWNASLRKYNLNPIVSGNIVTVDYPGNITINVYTFNGSIASGIGVSAITATPAPTIIPAPNEYNYVFDFLNITGIVADFEKARNASDGAVSTFSEALVGENKSNRSKNPDKTIITGTQSGIYNSSYLDSVDGNIDITRPNQRQIKTVVYYMGQRESSTDLASGTNFTTGPVSVYLPEQGVVVKQAWLELWQLSGTTTTTDVTSLNMYLNGKGYSPITGGTYQAETGESLITMARANVTPAFSAFINPTTFTAAVKTGTAASNAQALMLYITYEYDSNSPTQLKTVIYPLDTNTGSRSAGSTTAFNYNVSIPEDATTIRSSWFEIRGMIDSASTNDATIKAKIEPNATFSTGVSLDMADNDIYGFLYLFNTTSQFSDNTRQTLSVQNLAQTVYALGGEVVVTYEYSNNAPVQLKTVKYFVGQKTAPGGTALLSDSTTVFLPEQEVNVKSVWARVRSTYTTLSAGTQTIAGKIGGTPTISHAFTLDMNQKLIGDYMIIYNMTEAASSMVNNTLVFVNNTFNNPAHGPPATELYITYLYDPNSTNELKTVEYLAGQSQVQASARNDNFNIINPEKETIRRDAYIDYIVMSSATADFSTTSAVDTSFSSKTVNIDGTSEAITAGVLNNDLQDRITVFIGSH